MATYYVAAAGSDSNPGTSSGAPFATPAHALSVAVAGDTVNLNGGDTFSANLTFTGGITVQSYGTGQATINGGTGTGLQIQMTSNTDVVTVTNLIFTGSNAAYVSGTSYHGLIVYTSGSTRLSGGVTITGLTISGYHHGITIVGTTTGGINNIAISGNLVHDCQLIGIFVEGNLTSAASFSNVSVHDNTVHDITGSSVQTANTFGGYGIEITSCLTDVGPCTVYNNLVYNTGANSPPATSGVYGQGTGIWCQACNGLVVRNNVVHHAYATGTNQDGGGFDIDSYSTNCIFEYNISHDCQGAGQSLFLQTGASGNVIRFNLSINDATVSYGSLRMSTIGSDGNGGCTIHNNTFISLAGNPCVYLSYPAAIANKVLLNNLMYCASGPIVILPTNGSGTVYNYNCYIQPSFSATYNGTGCTSLSSWQTATGNDANSLYSATSPFVGPLTPIPSVVPGSFSLDTPYWLKPGSTPQGAGGNLSSLYSVNAGPNDLNGNAIGASGYSMGAISPAYVALMSRMGCGAALMSCG